MAEPTLTQVFGENATQTATTLTITKADLDLTASGANTAESLLAAIIKKSLDHLTEENRAASPTQQQISSIDNGDQIYSDGITDYLVRSIVIQFFRDYSVSTLNPDDY